MLRRHRQLRRQLHRIVDVSLFGIALWLAHALRDVVPLDKYLGWLPMAGAWAGRKFSEAILPFEDYVWLYLIILPLTPIVLESQGFYRQPIFFSRRQALWSLLKTAVILTLTVILAIFLSKNQDDIARSVIILFGAIGMTLVYAKEELFQWLSRTRLSGRQLATRLALVGTKEDVRQLREEILRKVRTGVDIAAELDIADTPAERLVDVLHEHSINGVVISAAHAHFAEVEKTIQACELEGVEAWLVADFFQTRISRTHLDDFYGRPIMVFHSGPEASWQGIAKQIVDLTGALVLLAVFALPMLLAALWIKLTSPGPVLFKQLRSGLNGHPFTMYKFRTMRTDAEQLKHEIARLNEMSGPVFKVTNDPRITPAGKWLRKFSIDECPQLFNVLKMEMSLVGPRPLPVEEVKCFSDLAHRRRLSVKPGLTCLWQISGRNNVTDFSEWVRLDLEYIDRWSLWLDLEILFKTIPVVLLGKGAK